MDRFLRINQFISHNSHYSRRQADLLVSSGRVNIGRRRANLGDVVSRGERVFLDGKEIRVLRSREFSVIVYHKPKGEIVSRVDDRGRRVIFDSLGKKFLHFAPIGRLDYASEGVLLLSDDKRIVDILMNSKLEREYILKIAGFVSDKMIDAMSEGLDLLDARVGGHEKSPIRSMSFSSFNSFKIIKNHRNFSRLKVCISEGKNRELRRFFAYFKTPVLDLRRVRYGFIHLSSLPVGKWRYLKREEYKELHEFIKNLL